MTEDKEEDVLELSSAQEQQSEDIITVVFTADNHLGYAALDQSPRKREERQQRLRRAFQQATEFAVGQGVDLFIQAGDLFDTSTPQERDRSFVAARLAQLRQANVRVFMLGGVHDTPAETHTMLGETDHLPPNAPHISYAHLGVIHYFAPNPLELEPVMFNIRDVPVGICGLGTQPGQEGNPLARIRIQPEIERAAISILVLHAPIEGLTTGATLPDTSPLDPAGAQRSRASGAVGSHFKDHAQITRASIEHQSSFRYILAGYHHSYQQLHIGQCDVIVAGATQHIDFQHASFAAEQEHTNDFYETTEQEPGFVFLGFAAGGLRWCKHIAVDTLKLRRLTIHSSELWLRDVETVHVGDTEVRFVAAEGASDADLTSSPETPEIPVTETILARLRPLCNQETMVQLRLEGQLTRSQYHQLDLNQIRRYGEQQCFALTIDDSRLKILSEGPSQPRSSIVGAAHAENDQAAHAGDDVGDKPSPPETVAHAGDEEGVPTPPETVPLAGTSLGAPAMAGNDPAMRFSPREELVALADEWIAAANNEQEKKILRITKEDLLAALDSFRAVEM